MRYTIAYTHMADTKNNESTVKGIVIEALPGTLFRVDVGDKEPLLTYLGGKLRINKIRILVGDKVEILTDPYGGKGRIIKRL